MKFDELIGFAWGSNELDLDFGLTGKPDLRKARDFKYIPFDGISICAEIYRCRSQF